MKCNSFKFLFFLYFSYIFLLSFSLFICLYICFCGTPKIIKQLLIYYLQFESLEFYTFLFFKLFFFIFSNVTHNSKHFSYVVAFKTKNKKKNQCCRQVKLKNYKILWITLSVCSIIKHRRLSIFLIVSYIIVSFFPPLSFIKSERKRLSFNILKKESFSKFNVHFFCNRFLMK